MDAEEGRIDRSAGHDGFAGLAECASGKGKGGDEAAEVDDLIEGDRGIAAITQVSENRVIEALVGLGIAEDAVVDAAVEGVDDRGSGSKIHVRHPEGIELRTAIVFDAAGFAARDWGVEVEIHVGVVVALKAGRFNPEREMICGWAEFKPKLAGGGSGGSVCGRARDEGERPTVERLCVPGLPVCVSGPEGS